MDTFRWHSNTVFNSDLTIEAAFLTIPYACLDESAFDNPEKWLRALGFQLAWKVHQEALSRMAFSLAAGRSTQESFASFATNGAVDNELIEFASYLVYADLVPVERSPLSALSLYVLAGIPGATAWVASLPKDGHTVLVVLSASFGLVVLKVVSVAGKEVAKKVGKAIGDVLADLIKEIGGMLTERVRDVIRRRKTGIENTDEFKQAAKGAVREISKEALKDEKEHKAGILAPQLKHPARRRNEEHQSAEKRFQIDWGHSTGITPAEPSRPAHQEKESAKARDAQHGKGRPKNTK